MASGPVSGAHSELCADLAKFGCPDDVEGVPGDDVEAMDFDASSDDGECMQCTDSQEETEVEVPMERTTSQLAKQQQVLTIRSRLAERQEAVRKLKAAVEALARESLPADGEADGAAAQRLRTAVDGERKRARNFGEDLVQDLLLLDKLSGLIPEDRVSRKAAISLIEAQLDDVDAAKSKIGSLEARVAALEAKVAELQSKAATAAAAAALEVPRSMRPPLSARAAEAPAPASARAARPASARAAGPPMPSAELWERVELPLRVRAHEEEDRYIISVAAQGMTPEDATLQLDDDESSLSICILRQPRAEAAAQMQKQVAAHLRQMAMRSPSHLEQILDSVDDLAADAYAKLGQGVFGRFAKSVEIPADADVAGIRGVCRNGVLQVVLPKRARRSPAPRMGGVPDEGFPAYGGRRGFPSRAPPGRPQGFPHPFFGGMGGGSAC